MARRRRATWVAASVVCAVAIAAGVSAARGAGGPLVGAARIGLPLYDTIAVDGQVGRAVLLDDGVPDRTVTLQDSSGGNLNYSGYSSDDGAGNELRLVDTHTGTLVRSIDAGTAAGLAVDPYTERAFTFDPPRQEMRVFDVVRGTALITVPLSLDSQLDAGLLSQSAVADRRSGHLFVLLDAPDGGDGYAMPDQSLLMLDGRHGTILRRDRLPPLTVIKAGLPGQPSTYEAAPITLLDESRGRLYLFGYGDVGDMRVFDTASGRLLDVRHLNVVVAGAALDARTGHIFILAASRSLILQQLRVAHLQRPLRPPRGSLLMIDARTGTVLRALPGIGINPGSRGIVVDQRSNLAFALDSFSGTVEVVDGGSGRLVRTLALRHPSWDLLADAVRQRAYVVSDGGITVIDTARGQLMRTMPLPRDGNQGVEALAVDPLSGHVIVVTSGLHGQGTDPWAALPAWLRSRLPLIPPPPPTLSPDERILHHTLLTLDPAR